MLTTITGKGAIDFSLIHAWFDCKDKQYSDLLVRVVKK